MVMQGPEQKKRQEQLNAGFTAASVELEGLSSDSVQSKNFVSPQAISRMAPLLRGMANDFAAANEKDKKRPVQQYPLR